MVLYEIVTKSRIISREVVFPGGEAAHGAGSPAGDDGRVLSLTPPLGIARDGFEDALNRVCGCFS